MTTPDDERPFVERFPTLQYLLLTALGAFGIWVAMPIDYPPQSTLEWIDMVINLIIFVPCSIVAVGSGLLTIASAVFSFQPDKGGRFAKFANGVLSAFGLRRLLQPDVGMFGPLALLASIFLGQDSEDSDPKEIPESSDDDLAPPQD